MGDMKGSVPDKVYGTTHDGVFGACRTTESLTTATATVTDQMPTMKAMLKAVREMRAKIDEQRAREHAIP